MTDIPSRNQPDPENLRQRPWQGGSDGLPDTSAEMIPPKYRDVPRTRSATVSGTGTTETGPVTHSATEREGGARVRITEQQ